MLRFTLAMMLTVCSWAGQGEAPPTATERRVLGAASRLLGTDQARPMYVAGTSIDHNVTAAAICPLERERHPRDHSTTSTLFRAVSQAASDRGEYVGRPPYSGGSGSRCATDRRAQLFDPAYYAGRPHDQIWQVDVVDGSRFAERVGEARRRDRTFIVYAKPQEGCVIEVMTGPGHQLQGTRVTVPEVARSDLSASLNPRRGCLTRAIFLSNGLMGAMVMSNRELAGVTGLWGECVDSLGNAARLIFQTKVDPGMPVAEFRKRLAASPRLRVATIGITDRVGCDPPPPLVVTWPR